MKRLVFVILVTAILYGCGASAYQAKDVNEWMRMTKEIDGSGCVYLRGNARPYADVSVLSVVTWGKNAPKYIDCLQGIPEAARSMRELPPSP